MERHIFTNTPDADHVMSLLDGARNTWTVVQACELELFDELDKATKAPTAKELAKQKGWAPDALCRLMDMMVALKLLKKSFNKAEEGIYEITDCGRLLLKHGPPTFNDYARLMYYDLKYLEKLTKKIRSGGKGPEEETSNEGNGIQKNKEAGEPKDPEKEAGKTEEKTVKVCETCGESKEGKSEEEWGEGEEEEFGCPTTAEESLKWHRMSDGLAKPYADQLVTAIDLSKHKTAVDLGAGTGVYTHALLRHYPKMKVILAEQDYVMPVIQEHFISEPKDPRLSTLIIDFDKDELPSADLYVLGNIIQELEPCKVKSLLSKIRESLKKDGAILILDRLLSDARDGPVTNMGWDVTMTGYMTMYTGQEYCQFLHDSKFKNMQIVKTQDLCVGDLVYALKD